MREIRKSGSEGGGALTGSPYPYGHQPADSVTPKLGRGELYRHRGANLGSSCPSTSSVHSRDGTIGTS